MKLTAREWKILAGIASQDGYHTARKVWRIFYANNDAYKVVGRLWWLNLVRISLSLRVFITEAGRAALADGVRSLSGEEKPPISKAGG